MHCRIKLRRYETYNKGRRDNEDLLGAGRDVHQGYTEIYSGSETELYTVATQVKFLEEKGFLTRRPVANTFIYVPVITEKEYSGDTIGNVVRQYYNNSYASVVSQFVEEEKMDLDELKALIAEIENRRK